jgi:rhodanese-related sulfurtransferase
VRAKSAAAVARKAGYTQVNVLSGGLKAWREANLPVEHG